MGTHVPVASCTSANLHGFASGVVMLALVNVAEVVVEKAAKAEGVFERRRRSMCSAAEAAWKRRGVPARARAASGVPQTCEMTRLCIPCTSVEM